MTAPQTILFACIHNSGRSVAAKVLAEHHAGSETPCDESSTTSMIAFSNYWILCGSNARKRRAPF